MNARAISDAERFDIRRALWLACETATALAPRCPCRALITERTKDGAMVTLECKRGHTWIEFTDVLDAPFSAKLAKLRARRVEQTGTGYY